MSRIEKTFDRLKQQGRKGFVPYVMGGDPNYDTSLAILKSLPESGADIIELGMPFTDPMADGPTIQQAGLRALAGGMTHKKILQMVAEFRKGDDETPVVLMGYFNPLLAYGVDAFCKDAREAGVDGLLIVDIPPEEADEIVPYTKAHNLDFIKLITPTTSAERLKTVVKDASGYLYYVSIAGITGTASAVTTDVAEQVKMMKEHTDLPIAVGFGIKTPDDVKNMAGIADAVVVGSVLVKTAQDADNDNRVEAVSSAVKMLSSAL